MPEVMECRLLNNVYKLDTATWTTAKQNAVNGFNTNTCAAWDFAFARIIKSDNAPGCGVTEPANSAVRGRARSPSGHPCIPSPWPFLKAVHLLWPDIGP